MTFSFCKGFEQFEGLWVQLPSPPTGGVQPGTPIDNHQAVPPSLAHTIFPGFKKQYLTVDFVLVFVVLGVEPRSLCRVSGFSLHFVRSRMNTVICVSLCVSCVFTPCDNSMLRMLTLHVTKSFSGL